MFVEGARTEPLYLQHWHRKFRNRVGVTVDPFQGGPKQLVDQAVRRLVEERRRERKGQGRAYDEIWCCFDRDEHQHFADAVTKAEANGINLAISNPCVELWFVLHFEDQTAHVHRHAVQSTAYGHLGCGKALTSGAIELLDDGYPDALRRAGELDTKHAGDGSPPGTNPSTSMGGIIESIRLA